MDIERARENCATCHAQVLAQASSPVPIWSLHIVEVFQLCFEPDSSSFRGETSTCSVHTEFMLVLPNALQTRKLEEKNHLSVLHLLFVSSDLFLSYYRLLKKSRVRKSRANAGQTKMSIKSLVCSPFSFVSKLNFLSFHFRMLGQLKNT